MKKTFKLGILMLLSVLINFSCSNENEITEESGKNTDNTTILKFIFPDKNQINILMDENKDIIQDDAFFSFLEKYKEFQAKGKLVTIYNGENEPYGLDYFDNINQNNKLAVGLNSSVTLYDNYDFTGSVYSRFVLNSNYNDYNETLYDVYRLYYNNNGSGGMVELANKVSSVKLVGYSSVVLTASNCPVGGVVIIYNHSIPINEPQFTKYVDLTNLGYICMDIWGEGISWKPIDNNSVRAEVQY